MSVYIVRRLVLFVPTAFGVSLIIFLIRHIIPGDAVTARYPGGRETSTYSLEQLDEARVKMGLNGSLPSQYFRWLDDALQGNLGKSFSNRLSVLDLMLPRIYISAELGFLAVALAVMIAIPGGILAAVKQDSWLDCFLRSFSMVFESMSNFWIAVLLLTVLLWALDWPYDMGFDSPVEWVNDLQSLTQTDKEAILGKDLDYLLGI